MPIEAIVNSEIQNYPEMTGLPSPKIVDVIEVFAFVRPQPQGSAKAYVRGGRAVITSDNAKLKPYRSEVAMCAQAMMEDQGKEAFPKHQPVALELIFFLRKPNSVPRKRRHPVVKPDIDKLVRATLDALTGIMFHDDAQVVELLTRKLYAGVEGVRIVAREVTQ